MHCFKHILPLLCLFPLVGCGEYSLSEEEEGQTGTDEPVSYTLMLDIHSQQNAQVNYPLSTFLFDGQNNCISQTTIPDEHSPYSPELTKGKYTLVLVSGLQDAGCSFPLEIITDSYLSMNDRHCTCEALQMGQIGINLNQSTKANLSLSYIVSAIYVSLHAVPENVESVAVEISPVSSGISFSGNYTDDGKSCRIECTKSNNSSWQAGPVYVFPSKSSKTHLSIQVQTHEGNQSYGYTYEEALRAGVPYHFTGNLTEGVHMDGSCQSEGWKDAVNEDFDFDEIYPEENPDDGNNDNDENGESGDSGNNEDGGNGNNDGGEHNDDESTFTVTDMPTPESIWNNVYIWQITSITPNEAEAKVIAPVQWESLAAQGNGLLSSYEESGITGWRTFTANEAKAFKSSYGGNLTQLNLFLEDYGFQPFVSAEGRRYLCDECTKTFSFSNNRILDAGATVKYHLRPIKTIRFRISE